MTNRLNPLKVSVNLTSTNGNTPTIKNTDAFSPKNVMSPLTQILKGESRGQ